MMEYGRAVVSSDKSFHDISSNYILLIRRLAKCDVSSVQRLVAYDTWSNTTFHLNFVELHQIGQNLVEKAENLILYLHILYLSVI